ncbi:MAG: hypothetical protein IT467_07530, partial [Dokdonella sp.]|nr:hypothetical protein [Dokdonella sp.]
MKTTLLSLAVSLALALPAAASFAAEMPAAATPAAQSTTTKATATAPELHKAMRALWHGHIVHTRAYAEAVKAGNAAATTRAADETVANAKEIANAVAGFYGEDAGAGMLKLLGGHWQGVKDLTDARHAGNDVAADKAMNELDENAAAVAKFLSGANPNLPYDAVNGLMLAHIGYHAGQIQQIMKGDKAGEAKTWK